MTTLFNKYKNIVPLIFLGCLSIFTILYVSIYTFEYNGEITKRSLTLAHFLALATTTCNLLVYFFARNYFKITIILTIVLGNFGLLNYTPDVYNLAFILPFEPVSCIFGLVYLFLNRDSLKDLLKSRNSNQIDIKKVNNFKEKYSVNTDEELENIKRDLRFVIESRTAAKELLKDRNES